MPPTITGRNRRTSSRSGYAFSHQQGFGDLIIKGELFKQVEQLISSGRFVVNQLFRSKIKLSTNSMKSLMLNLFVKFEF